MPVGQPDLFVARAGDAELSDRELLTRFKAGQEAAFAAILSRHGTMVLRVCQRVLERREDAEDAFQATFLVLARKAGTVAWQDSIGTWLHATAHRLACEVRRRHARRRVRESRRPSQPGGDAFDEVTSRELLAILDEELTSLPEENRGPLLLCCMEGMTGDEAANHLGCSPSTVKRRLRDAREMLQARLTRRGIALPMAAVIALLAAGTAMAKLPPVLAAATVEAAAAVNSGLPLPPGRVSDQAIRLARHCVPLLSTKLKLALCVLAVAVLVAGAALAADRVAGVAAERSPADEGPLVARPGVLARVETTLRTRGSFIRQFAFDGNPLSFFTSDDNPGPTDHFTLVFDQPVALKSARVQTGTPNGTWALQGGRLEVSTDGTTFEPLAAFAGGSASAQAGGRRVLAVRVRPAPQRHPLVISEFTIDSDLPVAVFHRPVEFEVDAEDAPEMAKWANRVARECERAYPMICDELSSDGFQPPVLIPFVVRRDATALAAAAGGQVIVSAGYFEANPEDVGAVIHTTSYLVQAYQGRSTPNWLVHGIADYVRFFKFEPGALEPPDPDIARYDGDSRETAAFLAYLVAKYDRALVRKLNAALRDGKYTDDIWLSLAGKPLRELGDEWHRALRP